MGKMKSVQEDTQEIQVHICYTEKMRVLSPNLFPGPDGGKKEDIIRKTRIIRGARKPEQKTDCFKALEFSAHFWCQNYLKGVDKLGKA